MIGKVDSYYRIVVNLGDGRMGEILLAEDTRLERTVAVKANIPFAFTAGNQTLSSATYTLTKDISGLFVIQTADSTSSASSAPS